MSRTQAGILAVLLALALFAVSGLLAFHQAIQPQPTSTPTAQVQH